MLADFAPPSPLWAALFHNAGAETTQSCRLEKNLRKIIAIGPWRDTIIWRRAFKATQGGRPVALSKSEEVAP
jgi:hypothetical protein